MHLVGLVYRFGKRCRHDPRYNADIDELVELIFLASCLFLQRNKH